MEMATATRPEGRAGTSKECNSDVKCRFLPTVTAPPSHSSRSY